MLLFSLPDVFGLFISRVVFLTQTKNKHLCIIISPRYINIINLPTNPAINSINGFDASSPSSGSWSNRQYSLVPWQLKKMTTTCACVCVFVWLFWEGKARKEGKHTHKHPTKTWEPGKVLWGCWANNHCFVSPYFVETMAKINESNQFSSFQCKCIQINMDVSKNRGTPKGWLIMENLMNKWMIWGVLPPLFSETPIYIKSIQIK